MSLPKEPRQQMINMMYLVLTAMLALNITREVLNAFQTINESIQKSNTSITDKNDFYYKQFDLAEANKADHDRVKPWNDKAKEVKQLSDNLVHYLGGWVDSAVKEADGYVIENGKKVLKSPENIDASTRIFVDRKHGAELRDSFNNYVQNVINLIPDTLRSKIQSQLVQIPKSLPKTDENPNGDWVYGTFHNIPVVAVQAMMSKYQNDVKNIEATVVKTLFEQIHVGQIQFDEMQVIAVPDNSYVLNGDEIKATVSLVAYNKTLNPTITSNVGAVKVENGIGVLTFKASGAGKKTVTGTASLQTQQGPKNFDWHFDYMVGNAGASMQIDMMNVMYIGVDNPITISASGYNIQDVHPEFPAGVTATKISDGKYNVRVTKQGDVEYGIYAGKSGASSKIGSGSIRVKYIPTPQATIARKMTGVIKTSDFKAQIGISAALEDFVYKAPFIVTQFSATWIPKNDQAKVADVNGYLFNNSKELMQFIERAKPGDRFVFDNIKAKGPDGRVRDVNSISLILH